MLFQPNDAALEQRQLTHLLQQFGGDLDRRIDALKREFSLFEPSELTAMHEARRLLRAARDRDEAAMLHSDALHQILTLEAALPARRATAARQRRFDLQRQQIAQHEREQREALAAANLEATTRPLPPAQLVDLATLEGTQMRLRDGAIQWSGNQPSMRVAAHVKHQAARLVEHFTKLEAWHSFE